MFSNILVKAADEVIALLTVVGGARLKVSKSILIWQTLLLLISTLYEHSRPEDSRLRGGLMNTATLVFVRISHAFTVE